MATLGWILVLIVGAGLLLALPRLAAKGMSRGRAAGSIQRNPTGGVSSSSADPDPDPDPESDPEPDSGSSGSS